MIRLAGLIFLASTFLLASCATVSTEPQADKNAEHQHDQTLAQIQGNMQMMHGMIEHTMAHMSMEHGNQSDASSKKSEEHGH